MIFLIEYDRKGGHLLRFQRYSDEKRREADRDRLDLDIELNRAGVTSHEVVILEATDEAAIRRTHRRYFETLEQLLGAPV